MGTDSKREYLHEICTYYRRVGRRFRPKVLDEFSPSAPKAFGVSAPCAYRAGLCAAATDTPDRNRSVTAPSWRC
jgi:hypothetical protein